MKIFNLFLGLSLAAGLLSLTACKDDKESDIPTPTDGDYTGIALNEICGGAADDKDDDWVEIYNTTGAEVDLSGVQLIKIDEDDLSEVLCALPNGTRIAAKGYLVVTKKSGAFSAGISNSKKVSIVLASPSGETEIDRFDRDADVGKDLSHELGGSYARIPDGTGDWIVTAESTPGAANVETDPEPEPEPDPDASKKYEWLVLNELNGNDPKYIELYNGSASEMDIAGVKIRKDGEEFVYTAPAGTTITTGGFLKLLADQSDPALGFSSGLSAKKSVMIELFAPDGTTLLDLFKNPSQSQGDVWGESDPKYNGDEDGLAYGRYPDGPDGTWYMTTPTEGTANSQGSEAISWE